MAPISEHDMVVLLTDMPRLDLKAGTTGIVIHVYPGGQVFEVEWMSSQGQTLRVETMSAEDICPADTTDKTLTRSSSQTVRERIARDKEFANALAAEVDDLVRNGELNVAHQVSAALVDAEALTPQQLAAIRADADPHLPTGPVIWRADLIPLIPAVLHIDCDQEDGGQHIANVPELPGTLACGQTPSEAMAKAQALALRVLAERLETGAVKAASFKFLL